MTARRTRRALALTLLVVIAGIAAGCRGCRGEPSPVLPPRSPDAAALDLFAAARSGGLPPDRLRDLFAGPALDEGAAGLLDALAPLGRARKVTVSRVVPMQSVRRTAVDLEADLEGGGAATYQAQAEQTPDGSWRIVWFAGPHGSWPVRRPARPAPSTVLPDR